MTASTASAIEAVTAAAAKYLRKSQPPVRAPASPAQFPGFARRVASPQAVLPCCQLGVLHGAEEAPRCSCGPVRREIGWGAGFARRRFSAPPLLTGCSPSRLPPLADAAPGRPAARLPHLQPLQVRIPRALHGDRVPAHMCAGGKEATPRPFAVFAERFPG